MLTDSSIDSNEFTIKTHHGSKRSDEYYRKALFASDNLRLSRNVQHALNVFFLKALSDPVITIARDDNWIVAFKVGTEHITLRGRNLSQLICEAAIKIQNFKS